MKPIILVDSSSDLPRDFVEHNNLIFVSLICNLDEKNYEDDFGETLSYSHFYKRLREGAMPTTSQVNIFNFEEIFRKHALKKEPIIYLAFDSAISGTYNSAVIARQHILEEIKEADITIIDTRSASIGEGLLVYKVLEMLKNDVSKEEIIDWIEDNKFNIRHYFVVEDLFHLQRGGRISPTKAKVGTLLNIKPLLDINKSGELINIANIRGRKKAIKSLAEYFHKNMNDKSLDVVGIIHGDCLEDALILKNLLEENYNFKEVLLNHVGPVIASHTGAGIIGLAFLGKERPE
ncbi:DegV family protein [Clostridium grantii]|uniref:EDD domain protein, DegV family n=1 Tax=Clostridium grantii DSM 8605 TaxID=1121316 RepID=A0A1M5W0X0_9CLOT|nr:DegV family protein [Clostridium grantii]SHH81111.1 EDD domain protein, DegV family [Clostridium grantii DSM 8605]